jgi:hypothetical protein
MRLVETTAGKVTTEQVTYHIVRQLGNAL